MSIEVTLLGDNGKTYKFYVIDGSQTDVTDLSSKSREIKLGKPKLRTSDGLIAKPTSDGRYKFIDNGIEVTAKLID